jgi:hypothetical protein
MLFVTKDNVRDPSMPFKFTKFVECVEVLQSFDFVIYGSAVYEYIYRCAAYCLPWRKYTSLLALIESKDIITIQNINAFYKGSNPAIAADVVHFFKKLGGVYEYPLRLKQTNFAEIIVSFENPFDSEPVEFPIELSGPSESVWPCDDLTSLIALEKETFVLFRDAPATRRLIEATFPLVKVQSFKDPQVWGLIHNIGSKILQNQTAVQIARSELYLNAGIRRVYALVAKGYRVSLLHNNVTVEIPSAEIAEKCSICLDTSNSCRVPQGIVTLPCKHQHHLSCLSKWAWQATEAKCPLCRAPFNSKAIKVL